MKNKNNRVAIIGASGYGGIQIVRLLLNHPHFEISYLGGKRTSGKRWNSLFPFLFIKSDPKIFDIDIEKIKDTSDYVILCLPNGLASQLAPSLIKHGLRVLDLSADYRFNEINDWKKIYKVESDKFKRTDKLLCKNAIYGLPELNRKQIRESSIVACPGCFPTASLLPLIPFLQQGLIDYEGIIIDAKSGTSGGGRDPKEHLLLSESSESISAYGVVGHRHTYEIERVANEISGHLIELQFTPHLVPMVRGILSTVYARLRDPGLTAEDCKIIIETFYKDECFIDVLPVGIYPSTKWVRNTNKCLISVQVDKRTGRLVLMSVIDNLIKGQAGQAIQNLNIMYNLPEEEGLPLTTYYP